MNYTFTLLQVAHLFTLTIGCALIGCRNMGATGFIDPVSTKAITPAAVVVQKKHVGSVQLKTLVLEREANKDLQAILSPKALAEALTKGIEESSVFSAVKDDNTNFILETNVTDLQYSQHSVTCPHGRYHVLC